MDNIWYRVHSEYTNYFTMLTLVRFLIFHWMGDRFRCSRWILWSDKDPTHREFFSKSYWINPKSDCIYHFPVDLKEISMGVTVRSGEFAGQGCSRLRDKIRLPNLDLWKFMQREKTWHGAPFCMYQYCFFVASALTDGTWYSEAGPATLLH